MIDASLLDYAITDQQKKILKACIEQGSQRKAATHLGLSQGTVAASIARVKRYASTEVDLVEGFKVKIEPTKPVKQDFVRDNDLLNLYVMTDLHIGMRAWKEECGDDWSLERAYEIITAGTDYLLSNSPNSKVGFLCNLGDALHFDGMLGVTPSHGHVLDVSGRAQEMIRTTIKTFREIIHKMLEKHEQVVVLHAQGNHDPYSAAWLQESFPIFYMNEPRVNVLVNPDPWYAYRHNRILLGFHHGHKKTRLKLIADSFNAKFRYLLGDTDNTFIHAGHFHRDEAIYADGSTYAERHETIASKDAHACNGGYSSGRSMKCITYNSTHEVGRIRFNK